jgi:hypothetical protein
MSTQTIEVLLPLLLTKKQVAYLLSGSIWDVEELTRRSVLIAYDDGGKSNKYKTSDVLGYVASLREKQQER